MVNGTLHPNGASITRTEHISNNAVPVVTHTGNITYTPTSAATLTAGYNSANEVTWTESIASYIARNGSTENSGDVFCAFMKFADAAFAYLHSEEVLP